MNRKDEIIKARGKTPPTVAPSVRYYPPPKSNGGCAEPNVIKFEGRYRLKLQEDYPVCDSITTWEDSNGNHSITWKDDVTETPWMDGNPKNILTSLLGPPSVKAIVGNLFSALAREFKGGFKVVAKNIFESRLTTCRSCPYWEDDARMGLGKCNHPKCGCTRLKLHLASQSCPQNLWGATASTETIKHNPPPK